MVSRLRLTGFQVVAVAAIAAAAGHGLLAQAQAPNSAPTAPASGAPSGPPARPAGSTPPAAAGVATASAAESTTPPADYVIGADDLLTIRVWQEEKMSGDVVVRSDGKVTLGLINDIQAAGLTPDQFRASLTAAASKFVQGPTVDVFVTKINSRKVYINGEVKRPDVYPLSGPTTVMQAIVRAGGLTEYADKGKITILRTENGKTTLLKVNYGDILNGKNLHQNYELKVGDIITVSD